MMKNSCILIFLTFSLLTNAQTKRTHIPTSKSIVGMWRETRVAYTPDGKTIDTLTKNYKVINADGSYYNFRTGTNDTTIHQYGYCEIKSDSTLVEHVNIDIIYSRNNIDSPFRYNLPDENTMIWTWSLDGKYWLNKKWARVLLKRSVDLLSIPASPNRYFYNKNAPDYNIDKDSLAVKGYDLTAYFINNKASKGSSKYQYKYDGIKYFFLNEKNKSIFIKNPEKYLPQFGGYCALRMGTSFIGGSLSGKHPINPEWFTIINNKLYLFGWGGGEHIERWKEDKKNLENANKTWKLISKQN